MKKEIKAWAIFCKTLPVEDAIVDVAFVGLSDEDAKAIKLNKSMFVNDNGTPAWTHKRYKLIPCTITYEMDIRPNYRKNSLTSKGVYEQLQFQGKETKNWRSLRSGGIG